MAATIEQRASLQKRARKKYISSALAHQLVRVDPNYKPYRLSTGCCGTLTVDHEDNLRSAFYCKRRWCSTCASITAATLINKYLQTFERLQRVDDLYFVTLTRPTIPAQKIENRIIEMQKSWRKLADLARKKQPNFTGIRKTEVKVSAGNSSLYHPHYHIIVCGLSNAKFLVAGWLRLNTDAKASAQDYRKIEGTENALLEVFKYSTKITTSEKDKEGKTVIRLAEAWKLDVIYKALEGKRIYQGFGGLTVESEDFDQSKMNAEVIKVARGVYDWQGCDWYHTDYGHQLTGYAPTAEEIALRYWSPKRAVDPQIFDK